MAGRAGQLSVPDLRAVARLLQFGTRDAARVLDRSSVAVDGAADTAFGLVPMRALAAELRDSAIRSTTFPTLMSSVDQASSSCGWRRWASMSLSWVTAQMGPRREGPPTVQRVVDELTSAAARLGPAVRCAQTDLRRHQSVSVDPAEQALLAARSHAGAARGQLRATLARRSTDHPTVLVAPLSAHPGLTPDRGGPAPRR